MPKQFLAALFAGAVFYGFAHNMGASLQTAGSGADKPIAIPDAAPGADPAAPRKVKENVVAYNTADVAMNAAKDKARKTLDRFDQMFGKGEPGTYTLKFPLTQNGETEHIWLQVDRRSEDGFIGRLANEPVNGNQYKMGQTMEVSMKDIEDWMVNQGDAIYGGYTARVALAQMPEGERKKYEKLFRD